MSPKGLDVLTKANLSEKHPWTVRTLDGTRLYTRSQREILPLELSTQR